MLISSFTFCYKFIHTQYVHKENLAVKRKGKYGYLANQTRIIMTVFLVCQHIYHTCHSPIAIYLVALPCQKGDSTGYVLKTSRNLYYPHVSVALFLVLSTEWFHRICVKNIWEMEIKCAMKAENSIRSNTSPKTEPRQ